MHFLKNARDNIAWLTNNRFERVGQDVIDSAIDTLNIHRPTGKQLQLGEVMTSEDKKLLRNTLYDYVLSVENEVEGREEQNKENEGEMTMIEKEKRVREILTTKISNNAGAYERIFAQSVAVGQDVEYSNHYKPHSLLQVFYQSLNTKSQKKGNKKELQYNQK